MRVRGHGGGGVRVVVVDVAVVAVAGAHDALGLDLRRGLDGACVGVGTAEAGHQCRSRGAGLDKTIAAAE